MALAIRDVRNKKYGYQTAAEKYAVPLATLYRRVKLNCNENEASQKSLGRYKPTFTNEQELQLRDHILLMESRLFDLSMKDFRSLAYEYAEKNKINHSFNKRTCLPSDPVLLLFDGHSTHTKKFELIELARENNVHIIVIPPHTSHRLQPLDVSFMFPLSSYYGQEIKFWLRNNPGKVVTIHEISKLFGAAFQRAATIQNAVSGFKNTGIYPYNPNIFPDDLFQPAETTDNLNPTEIRQRSPQPGPSVASDIISPCYIFPVPKSTVIRKKSQKRGKTTILTSTPELEALKAGHLTPKLPDKQTVKRNLFSCARKVQKKKAATKKKKQIIVDSTDSDESVNDELR
ncbi:hypothetical protein CBL_06435 [Carabus blaptoides fortunei]